MQPRPTILALVLLASACADPVQVPHDVSLDRTLLPPALEPPSVTPEDPGVARPFVGDPPVLPPNAKPPVQVDVFVQSQAVIDILFVVDSSGSMDDERALLADNFPRFLDQVIASQANFRIGVTTNNIGDPPPLPDFPSPENGKLRGPFIDVNTPDAQAAFRTLVTFDKKSLSRRQEGFEGARLALSPGVNDGFLRPGAALALIFLSDEDDASFGTVEFFTRFFRSVKGNGNEGRVSASAIAGPLPDGCVHPGEERVLGGHVKAGPRYKALVDATGGAFGSICDTDFQATLKRIAEALDTLRKHFPLSLTADTTLNPVRVSIDGVNRLPDPATSWQLQDNAVVFSGSYIPPPRSTIRVEYTITRGTTQ